MKTRLHLRRVLFPAALLLASAAAQDGAGPLIPPTGPQDGTYRTLGEIWDKLLDLEAQNQYLTAQNSMLTTQLQSLQLRVESLPLDTTLLVLRNLEEPLPWQRTLVDPGSSNGFLPSLAFSPASQAGIAYTDYTVDPPALRYATRIDGAWQIETVGSGEFASLAYTADGRPAIAYSDPGDTSVGGDEVGKLALFNGASWDIQTLPGTGFIAPVLRFGSDGQPRVAYNGTDGSGATGFIFARYDGSAWQTELVSTDGAGSIGMELKSDDSPVFVYQDLVSFSPPEAYARFVEHDGTDWQILDISPANLVLSVRLALSPDGIPHVIYKQSNELRFAEYREDEAGPFWQTETNPVVTSGAVDTNFDLAIGPDGTPVLIYGDVFSGTHVVTRPEATWVSEQISADSTFSPSLLIHPDGQPAIALRSGDGLEFLERAPYTEP